MVRAGRGKLSQISPSIIPIPWIIVRLLGAESLPESSRGISSITRQPHRVDTLTQKPLYDLTNQPSAQSQALVLTKQVDLVQLACKLRMVAFFALCESNKLAIGALDHQAKPAAIILLERLVPLPFAYFAARSFHEQRRVSRVPGSNMQPRKSGDIGFYRIANLEGFNRFLSCSEEAAVGAF